MFLFGENGLNVRTTITSNCTQLHALALQEAIECYSTTKYSKTFRSNSKKKTQNSAWDDIQSFRCATTKRKLFFTKQTNETQSLFCINGKEVFPVKKLSKIKGLKNLAVIQNRLEFDDVASFLESLYEHIYSQKITWTIILRPTNSINHRNVLIWKKRLGEMSSCWQKVHTTIWLL